MTPPSLTTPMVIGCYQVTDTTGHALAAGSGFWSGPVRLDTALAPVDGDSGLTSTPGYYSLLPTATITPADAIDTAMFRATWHILPPDTLLLARSTGMNGQFLRLLPQGQHFAGVEVWANDVPASPASLAGRPVLARRVPCPDNSGD
jgi:hypothetical protein